MRGEGHETDPDSARRTGLVASVELNGDRSTAEVAGQGEVGNAGGGENEDRDLVEDARAKGFLEARRNNG